MLHQITKPDTLDGVVDHLWYAIFGANGHGYAARLEKMEMNMEQLETMFSEFLASEKDKKIKCFEDQKEKKKALIREGIRYFIAFSGWAVVILKLAGIF